MEPKILNFRPNTPIYVVGDIHGVFNSLIAMIKRYEIKDSVIIVAGDCGLGFHTKSSTKEQVKKLERTCKNHNNTIVMIRGNHDDPSWFTGKLTKRILPVPDYTVINDCVLCVGGATSIDRVYRLDEHTQRIAKYKQYHPGATQEEIAENICRSYWPNEAPVYDEEALNEIKNRGIKIRHVVTHTCPSMCDPITKDGLRYWMRFDLDLADDVDNERNVMDQILNKLNLDVHPLETWTYGHYHRHNRERLEGIDFTMLGAVLNDNCCVDWIEVK